MTEIAERAHAVMSPSSAPRWVRCPGSVPLSAGIPDKGSHYARWGTVCHEVAALILEHTVKDNTWSPDNAERYVGRNFSVEGYDYEFDMEMADCVNDYVAHVESFWEPGDVLLVEQPVPLDQTTGEEGATGTSDCIIIKPNGEIVVIDLKTGKGVMVDADHNEQGLLYADGAAFDNDLLYGPFKQVRIVIIQPRLQHVSEWALDWAAFEQEMTRVRAAVGRVREANNVGGDLSGFLSPGQKQCAFCAAKAHCPALRGEVSSALRQTAPASVTDFPVLSLPKQASATNVAATDNASLAEAYRALPLVEAWAEAVRAAGRAVLMDGGDLPGFALYVGKRGARAWSSKAEAEKVMRGARLKQDEMFEHTLRSPTAMEKVLKNKPRIWSKLAGLIAQPEGGPVVARAGDTSKTPYTRVAIGDFPDLGEDVDPLS